MREEIDTVRHVSIRYLSKRDFVAESPRWCPGCGDFTVLSMMQKVLATLGIRKEKVAGGGGEAPAGGFEAPHPRSGLLGRGMRRIGRLFFCSWFFVTSIEAVELPPLPEVSCLRVEEAPVIDGRLDEATWDLAEVIELIDCETAGPGRFASRARLLYDDQFLYVAFELEDDTAWGTVEERDGPIWDEECVEVFLDPGGIGHYYFELNVSPKNVIYDSIILNRRSPEAPSRGFYGIPEWTMTGMRTGVHVEGERDERGGVSGWTVEYAIPFEMLYGLANLPPQPGDSWRLNLYRIDTPVPGGKRDHYAWSPTGRSAFHIPWRFGYLVFK